MKVNSQVNLDCGTWGDVNIDSEIEIQVNGIIKCHVLKNQGQCPGIQLDEIFVLKLKSVNKNKKVCKKTYAFLDPVVTYALEWDKVMVSALK